MLYRAYYSQYASKTYNYTECSNASLDSLYTLLFRLHAGHYRRQILVFSRKFSVASFYIYTGITPDCSSSLIYKAKFSILSSGYLLHYRHWRRRRPGFRHAIDIVLIIIVFDIPLASLLMVTGRRWPTKHFFRAWQENKNNTIENTKNAAMIGNTEQNISMKIHEF